MSGAARTVPERPAPPLSRRMQARLFRIVNVPMRAVLGLPVPTPLGRSLMLASIVGRRTGRLYRQPVSYVRDGSTLLTPGGGRWKLNLADGRPVRIRVRGHDLMVTPELVSDVSEVRRLLAVIANGNARAAAFTGIKRGEDGQFEMAGVERAVGYGFRVVRWHLPEGAAI
jgi:hypothetical protein